MLQTLLRYRLILIYLNQNYTASFSFKYIVQVINNNNKKKLKLIFSQFCFVLECCNLAINMKIKLVSLEAILTLYKYFNNQMCERAN